MPPEINYELCTGCGRCVEICAEDVFFGTANGEKPLISYPEVCFHCNCCVNECPIEGAIWLWIPLTMHVVYK